MRITKKNTPWLKKYRLDKGYKVTKRTYPLSDIKSDLLSYVYTIGQKVKDTAKGGVPVSVTISVDKEFKTTLYVGAGIIAGGIALSGYLGKK